MSVLVGVPFVVNNDFAREKTVILMGDAKDAVGVTWEPGEPVCRKLFYAYVAWLRGTPVHLVISCSSDIDRFWTTHRGDDAR